MKFPLRILILLMIAIAVNACSNVETPVTQSTETIVATPMPPTVTTMPTPTFSAAQPTVPPAPTLDVPSIVLTGHTDSVTELAWSPDGSLLASAAQSDSDLDIRLWNPDGQQVSTLKGHIGTILSLAWSPDGKLLASGSADQTVRFWNPDGSLAQTLNVGKGSVWALAWSPDGTMLAIGSHVGYVNPTVQLWHVDGSLTTIMGTKYTGGKFYNLLWSPDGQRLLGGAIDYKVWKSDGADVAYLSSCEHCTPSWGADWSPDSSGFALGDENGALSLYDRDGKYLGLRQRNDSINTIAWSPDGKLLAGGRTIWLADGTYLAGINGRVTDLAWSTDSQFLAAAVDNLINIVGADGRLVAVLSGHTDRINRLAWSPAGLILASASNDNTIRLWHVPHSP
jgi:WD40 repeat protein